ncbi:MAG: sortase [Candidatus Scatovivens sp.]
MEKKLIILLCFLTAILIVIFIYTITKEPEYDKKLYNDIYSEYSKLFEERIDETIDSEIENNEEDENIIYLEQNAFGEEYRVIGKIGIPKINVYSPVIYETTEELMKIAPTKLCGPNPNEIGNLCIIGHNYRNDQFFSNLSKLEIDDEIVIINNKHVSLKYRVYDKYEVLETDLNPINQDTNGKKELTLITCTKQKKYRLIVKCREL